jgi:hypothetical protein
VGNRSAPHKRGSADLISEPKLPVEGYEIRLADKLETLDSSEAWVSTASINKVPPHVLTSQSLGNDYVEKDRDVRTVRQDARKGTEAISREFDHCEHKVRGGEHFPDGSAVASSTPPLTLVELDELQDVRVRQGVTKLEFHGISAAV